MLIVGLMMCSIPLFWRRATVRVALHGLEFARGNGTDIDFGTVKEFAANFSLPPARMVHLRTGAL